MLHAVMELHCMNGVSCTHNILMSYTLLALQSMSCLIHEWSYTVHNNLLLLHAAMEIAESPMLVKGTGHG